MLLVATASNTQKVARCCWRSLETGVRPGMTLAHARALVPDAMAKLAEWASRYSPIVGVDECSCEHPCPQTATPAGRRDFCPDGLILDIAGCERTFRGEQRLALLIGADLRRMGFECRIGIGPSIGAAWAVSRFAPAPANPKGAGASEAGAADPGPTRFLSQIVSFRQIAAGLAPLPVRALRLDDATCRGLHELGIDRIDHLMALPRRQVPSRFGDLVTRRIDQALGQAMETIKPVRPRPPVRVERLFDGPTTQVEALELSARELIGELCRELLARESGVRVLEAVFERVKRDARGTEPVAERITLSRPTRNPHHLWSLLRPRLERLHLGYGVEGISLVAARTARVRHAQRGLEEEGHQGAAGRQGQDEGELLDTLVNRLGAERVLRARAVESHIPERGFRMVPAAQAGRALPVRATPARPTVLFERAEPADAIALMPDRPPSLLRWRGQERRVALGIGPERIGAEWWRWHEQESAAHPSAASLSPRDYFRVREEGGQWLWVYRELYTGHWFVHGVWG
jgi:protein ImuB